NLCMAAAHTEYLRTHEVRTTTCTAVEDEPLQRFNPAMPVNVALIYFRDVPSDVRETRAAERALAETQLPFDLYRGPLVRACVLRLGEDDQLLVLTLHHIVTDGWSMGILHRELGTLYAAKQGGMAATLDDLPVQAA